MKKSRVAQNLFLVLQLGISMMVPILLCTAAGYFIDKKFGTHWMIPLIILGLLSGAVSVWTLVKRELAAAKKQQDDIPEWQKKAFADRPEILIDNSCDDDDDDSDGMFGMFM